MKKRSGIIAYIHVFSRIAMIVFLIWFCRETTSSGESTCPSQYIPYALILVSLVFITGGILIKSSKTGKTSKNASCIRNIPENNNIGNKTSFTVNWIDIGRVISDVKDLWNDIKNGMGNNTEKSAWNTELVNSKYWFSFYKIKDNYITQYECENESVFWYNIACDIISNNINPGDVFVDIWAREWLHSMIAMNKVGTNWKVIAFQPQEDDYKILEQNMKLKTICNVDLRKDWPWIENDKRKYLHCHNRLNLNWFIGIKDWFGYFLPIEINSLDNLLINEPRINFIKINTPYWDLSYIIEWMNNILDKYHPKLLFQLDTNIVGTLKSSIWILISKWYSLFYIEKDETETDKFNYKDIKSIEDVPNWHILIYWKK